MKIRTALAALIVPMGMVGFTACGAAQDGCFEDGEQVSCEQGDDDDEGEWGDD